MSTPVDFSIVLCTYNRSESLQRTLRGFLMLDVPADLHWELIVVNNNSTDATPAVCAGFQQQLPLRHVFESKQGLSAAKNRGMRESTGQLIAFTDDDVDVDPAWLRSLWEAAGRHPEAIFFGGRIIPRWEVPPPRWFAENCSNLLLAPLTGDSNDGDTEKYFRGPGVCAKGANLAFRRQLFDRGTRFAEELGVSGHVHTLGEETVLMGQLLTQGQKGVYVPSAIVYHRIGSANMTERYVRNWYIGHGITKVRRGEVGDQHRWLGVPRYIWKRLVLQSLKYALSRWTRPSRVWLDAEAKMATAWGIIRECRKTKSTQCVPANGEVRAS